MCPDILAVNFFWWLPLSAKVVSIYRLTGSRELSSFPIINTSREELWHIYPDKGAIIEQTRTQDWWLFWQNTLEITLRPDAGLSGRQAAVRPGPRFQLIPNMWNELVCGGRPDNEIKYQHFVSGDNFILAGAVSACQPGLGRYISGQM